MRNKLTLLTLLLSFVSMATFAQTPVQKPATVSEKRENMKDLKTDIRTERREKAIRRHDKKAGNEKGVVKTTKQIKSDKKDIAGDTRNLKAEGVKHPVHRAVHHIRRHR